MTDPGIAFRLLDGAQARAHLAELAALHAEVYRDPPYLRDEADVFPFSSAVSHHWHQPPL